MNYTFYTTSEKTWSAMLEAISGARTSIFLEMYTFVDNTNEYAFFKLLGQKAHEAAVKNHVSKMTRFTKCDIERLDELKTKAHFDLIINKLTCAFIKNRTLFLKAVHRLLAPQGVFVLITPILLKGVQYSQHLKNISVKKELIEKSLKEEFGSFIAHSSRYFEDKGLEMTYICGRGVDLNDELASIK